MRFWGVFDFPGCSAFRLKQKGIATMLMQELDGIAEELGEKHGTGEWSEAVFDALVARCKSDGAYLQRLRKAARAKAPKEAPEQRQVRFVVRTLLDVIAEQGRLAREGA